MTDWSQQATSQTLATWPLGQKKGTQDHFLMERNGPFFGEEERATESLCEKDDIDMCTCYANKERSRKALSRPRKHARTTREPCKLRQATETEERREYNSHTDTSETAG